MKNLASKISVLGLFLLPIPAFASMADKYNAGPECTIQKANYMRANYTGTKSYYCVNGRKVLSAYDPSKTPSGNELAGKMNNGFIGSMKQFGTTLHEYQIVGNKLIKYQCKGYGSCSGPINKFEFGTRIK